MVAEISVAKISDAAPLEKVVIALSMLVCLLLALPVLCFPLGVVLQLISSTLLGFR